MATVMIIMYDRKLMEAVMERDDVIGRAKNFLTKELLHQITVGIHLHYLC